MARKQINELLNSSNVKLEDLLLIQDGNGTNFNITIEQLYDTIQSSTSGIVSDLEQLIIEFNNATSGINDSIDLINDTIFNSTSGIINDIDLIEEDITNLNDAVFNSTSGLNKTITDLEEDFNNIIYNSTSGVLNNISELETKLDNATTGINDSIDLINDTIFNSTSGIINDISELETKLDNATSGLNNDIESIKDIIYNSTSGIIQNVLKNTELAKNAETGYGFSGAFAGKPLTNNYVWEAGEGIQYNSTDVANKQYKVFSLDRDVHLAVDQPYWTTPTPGDPTDIGLFAGQNLPNDVDSFFEFDYDYNVEYNYVADTSGTAGTNGIDLTGFENSIGRIKLNQCVPGDQLRVRFDFNVIPKIANTTVEPALWYSNRDENDNITFTFPLTASPIFYGTGTVGKTYLNRIDISAWITSTEDVNALVLPSIKSDNQVTIQPIGMLVTILR